MASERARTAVSNIESVAQSGKVKAFVLSPNSGVERDALQDAVGKLGSNLPVLIDETQLVTQLLRFKPHGEAVVIDPKSMNVVYRGASDSLKGVTDFTGLGASTTADAGALGEAVDFRSSKAVSYVNDIAPILERNCVSCHRDGGIGPWSMSSHAMVQGWSPMMREVVMTQRMPPGRIDTHVGKEISNANGLTIAEQQTLIDWIDQGAKRSSDQDPLTQLTFDTAEFTIGEPDIVLDVPPQSIPATGIVDYRYVPVQFNFKAHKWLRAIEFVPGITKCYIMSLLIYPAPPTKAKPLKMVALARVKISAALPLVVNPMNLQTTVADSSPRDQTCFYRCITQPQVGKPSTPPRSACISMTSRLLMSCLAVWPASADS